MKFYQFFFPYRSHLETEVIYFKEQLAAQTRRADILQAKLLELATPISRPAPPPLREKIEKADKAIEISHGFTAYKQRQSQKREEEKDGKQSNG